MSARFTILNMMVGAYAFEVHAAGCRDIDRKHINGSWDATAASADDLVAEEVAEFEAQDQGYTADDFRIFPCCGGAK
jgi:hypothetical protein